MKEIEGVDLSKEQMEFCEKYDVDPKFYDESLNLKERLSMEHRINALEKGYKLQRRAIVSSLACISNLLEGLEFVENGRMNETTLEELYCDAQRALKDISEVI